MAFNSIQLSGVGEPRPCVRPIHCPILKNPKLKMNSLLSKAQKIDVAKDPFPHLIVYEPIEDVTCLQLLAEYPDMNTITHGRLYSDNKRFSYSASYALSNEAISPLWKRLVQTHVSTDFLKDIVTLFDDDIRAIYPWFEDKIGKLETLRAGIRHLDNFATADVLLDAQICINTPVKKASSVRGVHVDLPNKLFAGLFYLKHPEDTSTGGDLNIYRFRGKRNCFQKAGVANLRNLELVKTVKYERNVFIFFLNSIEALHGVSIRSETEIPRYLFNLVGVVSEPLFDLTQYQQPANKLLLVRDWFSSQVKVAATLPKMVGRNL